MPASFSLPALDLHAGPALTPMPLIRAIVLGYRRYGADPSSALAQAQIPPERLDDPAACVTAAQLELMSLVAMQELDDEALGWFSRRLPWGSYGMLCRASLTAPTLGIALKRWCRHHRLLTDDIVLSLEERGGQACLAVTDHRVAPALQEFCLLTSLRYVLGYACWAIDSRIRLDAVDFPFPAPAHHPIYPRLFGAPVRFAAGRAALWFEAGYLKLPLRRDERALRAMLQRALPLTVLQYRRDRLLVQRVCQLLRESLGTPTDAERLAARLSMSARTLHRQLQEEGATLQGLKDAVRRDAAIELLLRSQRPIKQVALAVGFLNEKSFARAFRLWTGKAPSSFRADALRPPA